MTIDENILCSDLLQKKNIFLIKSIEFHECCLPPHSKLIPILRKPKIFYDIKKFM